ncbi:SagB/ThcOx family dehydrogenase [Thermus oshimai]|jgi:SagB-type dehydrogenase family enzyme|uniref:SagB-type dehydrogenase domain protein n=1 Tax=Thermus oshimai JL-2 TaxID=751945 RepID=K7QW84_THEOS|nr:SagB/ThcOx family dehydrogenase [Thermus oshimai]AFV76891.1 SagB-type dehydrogenase domain protein [Thermus oshimai JL-2]
MEKHPGKLFYRLSRLSPGDELPLKRRPRAKVYANPLEVQALPPPKGEGGPGLFRTLALFRPELPELGASLTLNDLSQLLTPLSEREGHRGFPSAGEAYPLEVYLVLQRVQGVFPGTYHYFPKEHQLSQLASGVDQAAWREALLGLPVERAAALLVLTLVPERSEALFGIRGYRYALLEAGYAGGLVLLLASGLGLAAYPAATFYDGEVARLLALPEGEHPGLVILLGR